MRNFLKLFGSKKQVELNKLNKVLLVSGLLYLLQAGLVLFFGNGKTLPILINYLAYDSLLSNTEQITHSPGVSLLFDLNMLWLVVGILVILAIINLLLASLLKKRYETLIKNNSTAVRWIVFGTTNGFAMLTIALLSGLLDIASLLLMITVCAYTVVFGYLISNVDSKKCTKKLVELSAIKMLAVSWLVLIVYVLGTIAFGGNSINAFVYYIFATALLAQVVYIFILKMHSKKRGKWSEFVYSETAVIALSFILQSAVTWQVFLGTLR